MQSLYQGLWKRVFGLWQRVLSGQRWLAFDRDALRLIASASLTMGFMVVELATVWGVIGAWKRVADRSVRCIPVWVGMLWIALCGVADLWSTCPLLMWFWMNLIEPVNSALLILDPVGGKSGWHRATPLCVAAVEHVVVRSATIASILLVWGTLRFVRSRRRAVSPLCSCCSYNLTGNVSGRCPECGCATESLGKDDGEVGS
ncbi:MAG: hypothetical protein PVJ57_22955 [Phycisphaerae bacterium]|jgi:hypothetical protein